MSSRAHARVRPTGRGVAMLFVIPALYAAARLLGNSELLPVAAALALVWLVGLAFVAVGPGSPSVIRGMPNERLRAGDAVHIPYRLDSGTLWLMPLRDICETLRSAGGIQEFALGGLRPNVSTTVEFESLPRGLFRFGPTEVRRADPLGLWSRLEGVGEEDVLIVWPRTVPLPAALLTAGFGRTRLPDPRLRSGNEFRSLRTYTPGDDVRRVHWPSSAKRGKLLIRETHDDDEDSPVVVMLDCRTQAYSSDSAFELAVVAAASSVEALAAAGRELELLIVGTQEPPFPVLSQGSLASAMDRLAGAGKVESPDPRAAVDAAIRALPGRRRVGIVCTGDLCVASQVSPSSIPSLLGNLHAAVVVVCGGAGIEAGDLGVDPRRARIVAVADAGALERTWLRAVTSPAGVAP